MRIWSRVRSSVRRRVAGFLVRHLTKPLRSYEQRVPNSLANLKLNLRKGDVILVEGDQRVSQVIRYLTQSSWSHVALYIGDELRRFKPALAEQLAAEHGEEARFLVIEAVDDGVKCAPITKYIRHNLRVCRPHGLRREDLDSIIAEIAAQIGRPYNHRQVFYLALYFFPVSLIPRRFRRRALRFGSDTTRQVICSTMLARAFAKVGYPVLPRVTVDHVPVPTGWLNRLLRRNRNGTRALYRHEDPTLVTPRDFDLSPYFEVVKFNPVDGAKFDYRRIEWAKEEAMTSQKTEGFTPKESKLAARRVGGAAGR